GSFQVGGFVGALSLGFILTAGYSGGVADYSRYLPSTVSNLSTGLWTTLGVAIPTIWLGGLGIYVTLAAKGNLDTVGLFAHAGDQVGSWFTDIVFIVGLFGMVAQGFLVIYVAANTAMAITGSLRMRASNPRPSFRTRALYILPVSALGLILGEVATGGVATFLDDSLAILLILLVPWSAINLSDFYLVRGGHYSYKDMFRPHGPYGVISVPGFVSYFLALACEIPFIHVLSFEGPVASALGGGDISFVIGVPVGAIAYWALMRRTSRKPSDQPAVDAASA
ncbi:MAG: cytosine permease, partial [Nitrososphaerales archaeon]